MTPGCSEPFCWCGALFLRERNNQIILHPLKRIEQGQELVARLPRRAPHKDHIWNPSSRSKLSRLSKKLCKRDCLERVVFHSVDEESEFVEGKWAEMCDKSHCFLAHPSLNPQRSTVFIVVSRAGVCSCSTQTTEKIKIPLEMLIVNK